VSRVAARRRRDRPRLGPARGPGSGRAAGHRDQANQAFTPSAQAIEHARKLVDAAERSSDTAILQVDDEMVGPPFLKYARRVLTT